MKFIRTSFLLFVLFTMPATWVMAQNNNTFKNVKVLVYTKNGKGYVHDNIASAVKCVQTLGIQNGFTVDTTANPAVMTEANLKQYAMLIFPSTNNDVFDTNEQRLAFRRYIESGGGFVGLHSVTGTERNWKWFKMMLGGTFSWHAKFQKFAVRRINSTHPSMQGMPEVWEKEDECYFAKELYPGATVLMAHDITTLNRADTAQNNLILKNAGGFAELYPAVWAYNFDGGHTWVTVLGHDKKDYSEPLYMNHVLQGIKYVASQVKPRNAAKAYATRYDDPVRF